MNFRIDRIVEACEIKNLDYNSFMKKVVLEHYYKFNEKIFAIELLDSEKIQISKELNTIVPFFYGYGTSELLLENKLTLDEYQKAVESNNLEEYFKNIGMGELLESKTVDEINKSYFIINNENRLNRAELNSIVAYLNKEKDQLVDISILPVNEEIYINLVRMQPLTLMNLEFQTEKICIAAVSRFAHALEYVKEQTKNIAQAAVMKNGMVLEFVKDELHTEEIVKLALKQNPLSFEFSKLKTYDLCLEAVIKNGINYKFVPEEFRTHEMKMAAVNSNGWALKFFDKQTEEYALAAALQNSESVLCIDKDIRENNQLIGLIYQEVIKNNAFFAKYTSTDDEVVNA